MRIADIKFPDIANGSGCRVSIWLQGCKRHCKECQNPETWSFEGGREFTSEDEKYIFEQIDKYYCRGLSVLGGEPLEQATDLSFLLWKVKQLHPEKEIWLWTGYTYEEIKDKYENLLKNVDFLIDGEFIEEKKDISLKFRGSSNQKIIDLRCKE